MVNNIGCDMGQEDKEERLLEVYCKDNNKDANYDRARKNILHNIYYLANTKNFNNEEFNKKLTIYKNELKIFIFGTAEDKDLSKILDYEEISKFHMIALTKCTSHDELEKEVKAYKEFLKKEYANHSIHGIDVAFMLSKKIQQEIRKKITDVVLSKAIENKENKENIIYKLMQAYANSNDIESLRYITNQINEKNYPKIFSEISEIISNQKQQPEVQEQQNAQKKTYNVVVSKLVLNDKSHLRVDTHYKSKNDEFNALLDSANDDQYEDVIEKILSLSPNDLKMLVSFRMKQNKFLDLLKYVSSYNAIHYLNNSIKFKKNIDYVLDLASSYLKNLDTLDDLKVQKDSLTNPGSGGDIKESSEQKKYFEQMENMPQKEDSYSKYLFAIEASFLSTDLAMLSAGYIGNEEKVLKEAAFKIKEFIKLAKENDKYNKALKKEDHVINKLNKLIIEESKKYKDKAPSKKSVSTRARNFFRSIWSYFYKGSIPNKIKDLNRIIRDNTILNIYSINEKDKHDSWYRRAYYAFNKDALYDNLKFEILTKSLTKSLTESLSDNSFDVRKARAMFVLLRSQKSKNLKKLSSGQIKKIIDTPIDKKTFLMILGNVNESNIGIDEVILKFDKKYFDNFVKKYELDENKIYPLVKEAIKVNKDNYNKTENEIQKILGNISNESISTGDANARGSHKQILSFQSKTSTQEQSTSKIHNRGISKP